MEELTRVEFPVEDGVEIRTFGDPDHRETQHFRCVRMVYRRKEPPARWGSLALEVDSKVLLLDLEQDGGLIPHVSRITFDDGRDGVLSGRLVRITADVVLAFNDRFSGGYRFQDGAHGRARRVSEPFMLMAVAVLGGDEFAALEQAAYMKQLEGQGAGVANAWGQGGPDPRTEGG